MRLSFKAAFFSENTEIMGTEVLDFLTSERNKTPVIFSVSFNAVVFILHFFGLHLQKYKMIR